MGKRLYSSFLAVLAFTVLLPIGAHALVINTSSVKFNPKKTDQFQITGTLAGLSLAGVEAVRLEVGIFSQTVPLTSFSQKKEVFTFKGAKGQSGLSSLVLDLGKGKFSAKGAGLILSGLKNPVSVRLVAGGFDECSMPRFEETAKTWKFSAKTGSQFVCQIPDVPQTDPTGFLVNEQTNVRVQARILPSPALDQTSVQLFGVDAALNPTGSALCALLDNGNLANGDDIAGDSVFSCFASFLEPAPRTIRLIVQASLAGATIFSPSFFLDVVNPLTQDEAMTVMTVQQQASQTWQDKLAQFGDTTKARIEAVKVIRTLPGVQDAGISSDGVTIWILYESGLTGGLMLNPPGTRGGGGPVPVGVRASRTPRVAEPGVPPASFSRPLRTPSAEGQDGLAEVAGDEDTPVENTSVLVWDAYNFQFAPDDEGPALKQLFEDAECPLFNVTYLQDSQATVDSVRTFTQYGTIIMVTHGAVDGSGQVVFLTDEEATLLRILAHGIDLILGRVSILNNGSADVFTIRPSFIANLSGTFDNAIIYNGSCESSANNTMANAFFGEGAKTYFAYTRIVNSDFAASVATQLFTNLVTNLDNTGDAFAPVTPKVDPTAPNATFTMSGEAKLIYSGEFRNGNFETGDLTGYTTTGDGRVIVSLGEFVPTEGSFMGIISTGLGFTTESGAIEQNFCLPKTATELKFDWNFNSEEFIEWCGPQHPFNDPFAVELVTDAGTNLLFSQTIDSLCATVAPSGLAFDQSGPGCTPSSGVGLGTGGNDCTVWSTDWQSQTIDISAIAAANDGKGVTLRFRNFDTGDSIFDSAVLLDQLEIVTP